MMIIIRQGIPRKHMDLMHLCEDFIDTSLINQTDTGHYTVPICQILIRQAVYAYSLYQLLIVISLNGKETKSRFLMILAQVFVATIDRWRGDFILRAVALIKTTCFSRFFSFFFSRFLTYFFFMPNLTIA